MVWGLGAYEQMGVRTRSRRWAGPNAESGDRTELLAGNRRETHPSRAWAWEATGL